MRRRRACCILAVILVVSGCSPKRMGISRMADTLSSTASTFARDNDPEFVRQAAPSTLKMVEMLLDETPSHEGLLTTACSGFAQYAYAFLQWDAEMADPATATARDLRARAAAMYERARVYCLRALEVRHPALGRALQVNPTNALAGLAAAEVPALYWTAVAWGGTLALADSPYARLPELATVRALLSRALQLDETWEYGAIHEAMIALEALPRLLGGSTARAREHFERAVALSEGLSAFAYLTMATSVAQPAKDRDEFERLLRAAIAVDVSRRPSQRLANLIAQKRARVLLAQIDRLF